MKVLDSRVILRVEKARTEKIGEFEVPVGAGEYEVAKVVSIGPKVEGDIKADDTVYIYQNSGKKITVEGVEYRVVSCSEIIVVL